MLSRILLQNSFVGLNDDNMIKVLDPWNDLEDNFGKGSLKKFNQLKKKNPRLKTLVAIGGKCSFLIDSTLNNPATMY